MNAEPLHQCIEWAPPEVLRDLAVAQAGDGRHKCATCAYARGYRDGHAAGINETVKLLADRELKASGDVTS